MQVFNKNVIKLIIIFIKILDCMAQEVLAVNANAMNQGPCENFYQYVCQNYSNEMYSVHYKEITQKLNFQINKKLMHQFQISLQQRRNSNFAQNTQIYFEKMLIYFKSCQAENHKKVRNVRKYFEEIKPGLNTNWPLLESNRTWLRSKGNFSFWPLLGDLQSYGFNNVLVNQNNLRIANDTLNIYLSPPSLTENGALPAPEILEVLLRALNITERDLISSQLNQTDIKLWQILQQFEENSYDYEELSLQEFSIKYSKLKQYLEHLLDPQELQNISSITLENPSYFLYLQEKSWSSRDLEHLVNYLMLKFLYYVARDSTEDFTSLLCEIDLRYKFDLAINYISYHYFYKLQQEHYEPDLKEMLKNLRATMGKYLKGNPLNLSSSQLQYLLDKLESIKINIGNLPFNADYAKISNFYADIPNLQEDNYYKNHLLLLKHLFRKSLLNSQDQTHYVVTSKDTGGVSSPFYVPQQNMIIIPIGSFQLPLYCYDTQTALQKLSVFGFVLAHELAHAFDTTGLQYNNIGYVLDNSTNILNHENFTAALDCMQQQESTDEIDERISDFFGIRVAYRTYADYYAKPHEDWQKDFFKNLAQFFCGQDDIVFIDHDSDPVRLQQIVKNFPPFAQAFGCMEGSAMNPKSKCRLY